jgi:hypothetical protein
VLLWKLTKAKTHTAFLLAKPMPPNINLSSDRFAMFNKKRDISFARPTSQRRGCWLLIRLTNTQSSARRRG